MNNVALKNKPTVDEAYDSPAWWYDLRGFMILTFAYNATLWAQVRFFGRNIGERHLDLACGSGTLLEMVLRWNRLLGRVSKAIVGVDYAPAMIEGAQRRFKKWRNIEMMQGDASQLPFDEGAFDTINIANAIHCMPDPGSALEEAHRVLRPGGQLALNALLYPKGQGPLANIANRINVWGKEKGILTTPFHAQQVVEMTEAAGFTVMAVQQSGNCLEVVAHR